jgi:hypothetical protein
MKKSHVIFVLVAVALLTTVLCVIKQPDPSINPVHTSTITPVITDPLYTREWPEYNQKDFDRFIYREDRQPSIPPQLASYLTKQPEWNPTMKVLGMYRVDDNVPTLSNKNVTPYTIVMNTGYILLHGNPSYLCKEPNCISLTEDNVMDYDELIIFDYAGNVLHKLHTEPGYTFVEESAFNPYNTFGMEDAIRFYDSPKLWITVNDQESINKSTAKYRYSINLLTGEI